MQYFRAISQIQVGTKRAKKHHIDKKSKYWYKARNLKLVKKLTYFCKQIIENVILQITSGIKDCDNVLLTHRQDISYCWPIFFSSRREGGNRIMPQLLDNMS